MRTLLFTIPALANALSGGTFGLRVLLILQMTYFYVTRYFLPDLGDYTLQVKVSSQKRSYTVRHALDIAGLAESFIDQDYAIGVTREVGTILDLGAHIGDSALYFRSKYPEALIVMVEPASNALKYLQQNFETDHKCQIIQGALMSEPGVIDLQITTNPMGNSVKTRKQAVATETVPGLTMSDICARAGVSQFDIIKFDIEGGEDVLLSLTPSQYGLLYIGEIHLDLLPNATIEQFTKVMSGFSVSFARTKHPKRYIMQATYEKDL